jgi:hypothetical protein
MNKKLACTVISASLLTGCESTLTEIHATPRAAVLAATSVTPIDISNGIDGGPGGRTISHDGVILGEVSRLRSWWQSSASPPNILDSGFVNGGNRNADAAGGQAEVILSSNGGPPWTSVTLQSPPGTAAGNVLPSDINDSRVVVGRTVGTFNIPLRWPSPTSAPEQLSLAGIQYPVYIASARAINNSGDIVGYVLENLPKNKQRYEAIIWKGGSMSILPRPAGVTSQLASNINDGGVISGIADGIHPIRWTPRLDGGYDIVVASVDVGAANLETAIDACGRIGGGSDSGAWIWEGATVRFLPAIAGAGLWGLVRDLNESGTAVGTSTQRFMRKNARIQHATAWTGLGPCP